MSRNHWFILLVGIGVGLSAWVGLFAAEPKRTNRNNKQHNAPAEKSAGVAVIELFTSEGCSSCPSADRALVELADKQVIDGSEIYPLSFHVDYWDKLGWKDRFADKAFTARQQLYAKTLELDRLYTPQMIVNGRIEFVGSNRDTATKAIEAALDFQSTVMVSVSASTTGSGNLTVKYDISAPQGSLLNIAIVEEKAKSDVKRGENSGAKLSHANVVRVFRTIELAGKSSAETEFQLPKGMKIENTKVIAYAQDARTLTVLGASRASVDE